MLILQTSGSTFGGCGNGDTILQCEKDAILNLNTQIAASGVAIDVGLVSFASDGTVRDVDDDPGVQNLAPPDGKHDVQIVSLLLIAFICLIQIALLFFTLTFKQQILELQLRSMPFLPVGVHVFKKP